MSKVMVRNIVKRFGDVLALDHISFAVDDGEVLGLLGPSGCGKTTTLNVIAGFDKFDEGEVFLNERDVGSVPVNERDIGIVFQTYALFPHMTCGENVGFGLSMRGIRGAERKERIRRTLELVQLEELEERYPNEMSGGQRQRVALARALAIEPALLLLDEPLSNLDAKLREEMQLELKRIQRRVGITTILVTHDQSEALALCDRIAVMDRGRILQINDPLTIYDAPRSISVANFIGRANSFRGKLIAQDRSWAVVSIDGSEKEMRAHRTVELSVGDDVALLVRPERVRLSTTSGSGLAGVVSTRVFQGSSWIYEVATSIGTVIVMQLSERTPSVSEGDHVALSWDDREALTLPLKAVSSR